MSVAVSDTVHNKKVASFDITGPASYATGGFEVDQSAAFAFLDYLNCNEATAGTLKAYHLEWTLNVDGSGAFAPGKARVKVMRDRYDKASIGAVSGNPGGTTVQASKTATGTTTGSSHSHTMDHNHPNVTSSAPAAGGVGVDAAIGQPAIAAHTHDVDLDNFTGSTATGTHTHDRSFEYEHSHAISDAATNAASVEIANGTNLSATVWRATALGEA